MFFLCSLVGAQRDLHVPTHPFPTRRSSDLISRRARQSRRPRDRQRADDGRARRRYAARRPRGVGGAAARLCRAQTQRPREPLLLRRQAAGGSEEHTSELQSLMRISYAVFCLKKNKPHYILRLNILAK